MWISSNCPIISMKHYLTSFLPFFILMGPIVAAAVSCGGAYSYVGFTDLVKKDQKVENKRSRGYVVRESLYTFQCCGVINAWEILAGYTGAIELMVWQSVGTDEERLVGKNVRIIASVNIPGGEEKGELLNFTIPEVEQIIVQPGDQIGWYCSDLDILVAYRKGGSSLKNNYYMEDMTNTNVGETAILEKQDNDATFAIKAYTEQGSAPTLTGLPTSVTIDSDLAQGSTIYLPVVTDSNSLDTFTFSETGVVSTYFAVNSATGAVTVSTSSTLVPGTYTVDITVTDTCLLSSTATLTVIVQNQSPVIQGLPTTTSIHEDTTGETTVYEYQTTDVEGDSVACSLPINSPFYIKKVSASHYVCYKGSPALSYSTQSVYSLSVQCTDGFNNVSSTITVLVLQNQSPTFTNIPGSVTVSAKTTASSVSVFTVTAFDPDDNQTTFSMTCSSCPFTMFPDGRVVTSQALREETAASFVLSVTVSDTTSSVGPVLLTIILIDHNSVPSFTNLPKILYLSETTVPGITLYTISFTDPDVTDMLSVAVDTIQPTSGGILFGFNTLDGSLYTRSTATLDYEYLTVHNYTISYVVDDGITSSTSSVEIHVLDENEAPSFSSASYSISTNEDDPGTALPSAHLTVTDPDAGDNYAYSIAGGIDAGKFAINQSTGVISFAAIYDVTAAESPKITELVVMATDNGGLTGTTTVSVTVTNVNKPPTFTNIPQVIPMSEGVTSGTPLYVITTNDPDGDTVQVSMTPDTIMTSTIVTFNSTLNALLLADGSSLDYETCTVHNLTFLAFDGTDQSGYSTLTIQVTNVNEPPVFAISSYHVTVSEALMGGVVFPGSSFTVTDKDIGDTHTYGIASGTEAAYFSINQSIGEVSFAADYDVFPFESPKTTVLIIKATDSGYLTGTTTLSVTVTNVNKPPYFSNLPQIVTIAEDIAPGSTIYVTSALDPDLENVQVAMTTDTLLTSAKVIFNDSSGTLTVKSLFDYETCAVHIVTFTAFDGTTYSTPANLTIHVTNVNEDPHVAQDTYFMSAEEGKINDALTLPVPLFNATDPDGDSPLTFSLVSNSHSPYFTINATSGVLYYTVDFICSILSPDVAVLVTRISDPNGGYTDTNIQIAISHTNTKPQALNLPLNITFPESYAAGGFMYTVNLYDPDGDSMNCQFQYSPSSAYSTFAISQSGSTLNFSLSGTFDYEVTPLYTIYVTINDGIEDSNSYELHISISDVNEPPSFSQHFFDVTAQEDKNGSLISTDITFTDEDDGDVLTISIKDGNSKNRFYLDSSAKLFLHADYDVDDTSFPDIVNLTLEVKDSGLLSATTVVSVTLTDINDNVPIFGTTKYVHSTSNSTVGSTVLTVTASDLDRGINGACVYLLNDSNSNPYNGIFAVSEFGSILLMKSITDYASDHVFIFDVIVADKGSPSLSSTSEVRLIITQEVVSVPAATSAQVAEQPEVDLASIMAKPEMIGMVGAVIAGIALTAIGNIVCWLRMASKAAGKATPTPEPTKIGKTVVNDVTKPLPTEITKVPNPPLQKPKMLRSSSNDTQVEDYSCWDEVRDNRKPKLSQTMSDPGSSTSRVEVMTPLSSTKPPRHMNVSRTRSVTQYVSHMTGQTSDEFI